jgi:hypothetical protein
LSVTSEGNRSARKTAAACSGANGGDALMICAAMSNIDTMASSTGDVFSRSEAERASFAPFDWPSGWSHFVTA